MKIVNIPRKATEVMLTKMLKNKIKGFNYDKIVIEKNKTSSTN